MLLQQHPDKLTTVYNITLIVQQLTSVDTHLKLNDADQGQLLLLPARLAQLVVLQCTCVFMPQVYFFSNIHV